MSVQTLSCIPQRFSAGDTIRFNPSVSGYSTDDWDLKFSLSGPSSLFVDGTVEDDEFLVLLTSAQTSDLKPGNYLWAIRLTAKVGGDAATVSSGSVAVGPNLFATQEPSPTATLVTNLEAAINKLSTKTRDNVTVNGLTYSLVDIEKLYKMLRNARADLKAEQDATARASGVQKNSLIKLRFGRP